MIPKIANVNPSQVVDILNKTGNCMQLVDKNLVQLDDDINAILDSTG